MRTALLVLTLLLLSVPRGQAQVGAVRPGELDSTLDSLFSEGKFVEVEVTALRMLHGGNRLETPRRVAAHLYLGFVWELSGRTSEAKEAFFSALDLQPALRLNDIFVPPRLYAAFEAAREEHIRRRKLPRELRGQGNPRRPYHSGGTLMNLLLPGTGFFVSGEELRGLGWGLAQLGTALAFTNALVESEKAHENYLAETNPLMVDAKYDVFNTWYRRSWYWGIGSGVVYLLSQVDYQLGSSRVEGAPSLLSSPSGSAPGLSLRIRF